MPQQAVTMQCTHTYINVLGQPKVLYMRTLILGNQVMINQYCLQHCMQIS